MHEAFDYDLDEYIYFGGYPGSAAYIRDEPRWRNYVRDGLIEPSIEKDILMMTRVDKPALLKQLFHLGCKYSGQLLSYTKMLGQLQDAGNTVTLAHYLDLLGNAGMIQGLQKYAGPAASAARIRTQTQRAQHFLGCLRDRDTPKQKLKPTAATGDVWWKARSAHICTIPDTRIVSFITGAIAATRSIS